MAMIPARRAPAGSVEEMLRAATSREPLVAGDSKSGARFERVVIDGERYVVKHLHVDDDWIMRTSGDVRCRPAVVWQAGLLDELPTSIDPAIVAVAEGEGRNGWGCALLMRDVGELLVPEGDHPVSLAQHLGFIDHMADLHAAFWGWQDVIGLLPPTHRLIEFHPHHMALEAKRGWPDPVPPIIVKGWEHFPSQAGPLAEPVIALVDDPGPLVGALAELPQTFLHGDWKMGNLGSHPDGRTILLDWAMPGQGCGLLDLHWYLALNSARLPHSKPAATSAYRQALAGRGIETASWWDRGVALARLTGLVWFGWEKCLAGPGPELQWWLDGAAAGLQCL
jgi:hypothetical protein